MFVRRRLGIVLAVGWLIVVIAAASLLESRGAAAHMDHTLDTAVPTLALQP